jgi:hypothetical protein
VTQRDDDLHTADQWHHHLAAIRQYLQAFQDGALTAGEKQKAIAAENRAYYGTGVRPGLVRTGQRDRRPA